MSYPLTFEVSTTDGLTGLLDPYYFRHLLREELLPQSRDSQEPLCLFLTDIDGFLAINQTHGRVPGDLVLVAVADGLRSSVPETAVLVRYGGDEFGGVLPATRLDDAFSLLEKFRRQVASLKFDEYPGLSLTCSVGLAAFPANGSSDVELVREADQALYVAKSTGRNKVSLPLADSRMITKTSHYTATQLERLAQLARSAKRNEASLLREGLDDLFKKHNDQASAPLPE